MKDNTINMAHEGGRPTKMTQETIALLEQCFSNGASDIEACFIAGISTTTLYNYGQEYPEFLERKEALKELVKYQARKNIAEAIRQNDKTLSQWYLERKAKDEFAQRSEHTGKDGAPLITEPSEEIKQLAEQLNELKRNNT